MITITITITITVKVTVTVTVMVMVMIIELNRDENQVVFYKVYRIFYGSCSPKLLCSLVALFGTFQ